MHDTCLLVQILQRLGDLDNDVSREVLAEVGQANDLVEELATRTKFEDQVVVLPRFGEVDQFDDVGVVQLAHNLHLFEDVCSL